MSAPHNPGRNWTWEQAANWHAEQAAYWRETATLYRRLYIAAVCTCAAVLGLCLITVKGAAR